MFVWVMVVAADTNLSLHSWSSRLLRKMKKRKKYWLGSCHCHVHGWSVVAICTVDQLLFSCAWLVSCCDMYGWSVVVVMCTQEVAGTLHYIPEPKSRPGDALKNRGSINTVHETLVWESGSRSVQVCVWAHACVKGCLWAGGCLEWVVWFPRDAHSAQ